MAGVKKLVEAGVGDVSFLEPLFDERDVVGGYEYSRMLVDGSGGRRAPRGRADVRRGFAERVGSRDLVSLCLVEGHYLGKQGVALLLLQLLELLELLLVGTPRQSAVVLQSVAKAELAIVDQRAREVFQSLPVSLGAVGYYGERAVVVVEYPVQVLGLARGYLVEVLLSPF